MTIDWLVLLTPLLVLPILLLFRFAGCGQLLATDDGVVLPERPQGPPTSYPDYILGKPAQPGQVPHDAIPPDAAAVVAYWRLVDPGPPPPSNFALPAKDQKAFRNGTYRDAPAQPAPVGVSEANNGDMTVQATGLIAAADGGCRLYNGGYVLVEFVDGLYPDEFTIEAWVRRHWGPNVTGFEHVLFEAGGNYVHPPGTPRARRGFRLWADEENRWQFHLAPTQGTLFGTSLPAVPNALVHVAVSVASEAGGKRVRFYVGGAEAGNVTAAAYSPAVAAPLLMAAANAQNDPSLAPQTHRPFIGEIQEVVLHRKALSPQEVENHFQLGKGP
jgi:hypothetical protein